MSDNQNTGFDPNFYAQQSGQDPAPQTYKYVFNQENQGEPVQSPMPTPTPAPQKKKRAAVSVLTIVLCAAVSFVAAFAGMVAGKQFLGEGDSVNAPPKQDQLHQNNAQDLLIKDTTEGSIYGSAGDEAFSVSQVAAQVRDAVVVINATVTTSGSIFGGAQSSTSAGSGVIISPEGYILTCHHVVDKAHSITITLNSGSKYEALLVGSDAASDLAVLRIQPNENEPLPYVEQGCSADLVVGERVVAIGNPLGTLGGTVTDGIISATERQVQISEGSVMTLIQTNAAINSGNSGGGLFNLDGKLIGIVNAKYAAAGVEGLAFAIPIDMAYRVQLDLIQYGYVRGVVDHGLSLLDVTQYNQNYYYSRYKIDTIGVYIVSSQHEEALQNKDRIVSVNGVAVTTADEFNAQIEQHKVGDTVTLVIERNGKQITVPLLLHEYVPDEIGSELT